MIPIVRVKTNKREGKKCRKGYIRPDILMDFQGGGVWRRLIHKLICKKILRRAGLADL
jgi:hypothetical protein